jgi:hypothetical protein
MQGTGGAHKNADRIAARRVLESRKIRHLFSLHDFRWLETSLGKTSNTISINASFESDRDQRALNGTLNT